VYADARRDSLSAFVYEPRLYPPAPRIAASDMFLCRTAKLEKLAHRTVEGLPQRTMPSCCRAPQA
jgi:hypothetical protein